MTWEVDDVASILVPTVLTDTMVTQVYSNAGNLAEDSTPVWLASETYAVGNRVHVAGTHRVYESVKASNINNDPTVITNQFNAAGTPTWWVDVGPTNKWAMFDGLISTPTVAESPMVITLRPGAANALAMFGLDADALYIDWKDAPGGSVIYSTNGAMPLDGSQPADWDEYFFEGFKPRTEFTKTGVETFADPEIIITLTKVTGPVKVGMLTVGELKPMGTPERGARVTPKTYSYIVEDAYGNVTIKRRPSAMGLSIPIKVPLESADGVLQMIQDLLDVPVAVIGSTDQYHGKLSTFGLVSGDMDYSTYPDRTLNLTVKGFI